MSDILSREEVERRLAECVLLGGNVREREALETALAAIQAARIGQAANLHDSSWPEREYYSLLASIRAERDALAAEVERLRDALVAADRLLAEIGVRRAEPQTWEEMVMAVERKGAAE